MVMEGCWLCISDCVIRWISRWDNFQIGQSKTHNQIRKIFWIRQSVKQKYIIHNIFKNNFSTKYILNYINRKLIPDLEVVSALCNLEFYFFWKLTSGLSKSVQQFQITKWLNLKCLQNKIKNKTRKDIMTNQWTKTIKYNSRTNVFTTKSQTNCQDLLKFIKNHKENLEQTQLSYGMLGLLCKKK